MPIFDEWADSIIKILKEESELVSKLVKHPVEVGNAREALIKGVLDRILPSIYDVGTGIIVDHLGKSSRQIDIVISRRDMPALKLPSGSKVYLFESVLATIEIKSTLTKGILQDALENCASVANLIPSIQVGSLDDFAAKKGLTKVVHDNGSVDYKHTDPLETARFSLIPRPVSYVLGYKGYKDDTKSFAEAISEWATPKADLGMKHYPAVICTEGCLAWRNDVPYSISQNKLLLIAKEKNPFRLFILHLLYTLSRKIPLQPDYYGVIPNLDTYLQQMNPPQTIELTIGEAFNKS